MTPDWLAEIQAEEKRRVERMSGAKKALLTALKAAGVASVRVDYDGEGDSGQIEGVTFCNGAEEPIKPQGGVTLHMEERPRSYDTLPRAVEDFAWFVLGICHSGFENDEGGYGELNIDVGQESITLDHNDRFIEVSNTLTEV